MMTIPEEKCKTVDEFLQGSCSFCPTGSILSLNAAIAIQISILMKIFQVISNQAANTVLLELWVVKEMNVFLALVDLYLREESVNDAVLIIFVR